VNPAFPSHVLIVEDDVKIAAILNDYLVDAGFSTTRTTNGTDAVALVKKHGFDLMLLDLMLPGLDGIEVCKAVRQFSEIPIIMLTARVDEIDRLLGLDSGADDYVCKPFSPREVVARVKAHLRIRRPQQMPVTSPPLFKVNDQTMQVELKGVALALTPVEFRLLSELIRHSEHVYSRQKLLDCLHDDQRDCNDRTIDSHIKNIRRKLGEREPELKFLHSIYGVGYRFEIPD
jgi:two-component system response regulator BaeR